jgi:hypothetical protein
MRNIWNSSLLNEAREFADHMLRVLFYAMLIVLIYLQMRGYK